MSLITAEVNITVPFQDLDPMEVVWHGNYFRYFEEARAALLRMLDYDYPQMRESGFMWPIVDTRVKFVKPVKYAQRISVIAALEEWENRLKISYTILDAISGERLTAGHTVQCAVDINNGGLQLVTPAALRDRVRRYL